MQLVMDGRAGSAELTMVAATSTMLQRKNSTMDLIFRPEEEGYTKNGVSHKLTTGTMLQSTPTLLSLIYFKLENCRSGVCSNRKM